MTRDELDLLVARAGLETTFAEFTEDVRSAAAAAAALRAALVPTEDPADEPWPPARIGDPS